MNHISVVSSNLRSVAYDDVNKVLEVAFKNGGVYQYFGVPRAVFDALLASGSKGGYLASMIKNRYTYAKV